MAMAILLRLLHSCPLQHLFQKIRHSRQQKQWQRQLQEQRLLQQLHHQQVRHPLREV
jgi:hypothetical protein